MSRNDSERGAALIHVAIVLIGLFLFSGFVVDYGTFWVARGQAQNAADAGALAGATARLFDDQTNPPSATSGKVYDSVVNAAGSNPIWGLLPPPNTVSLSFTCPDATTLCTVVDVYRDGTNNSSTLPTFFLKLVSVNSQGTKAHAVAKAVAANGTGCLRPWFIVNPAAPNDYETPRDYGKQVTLHENLAPGGYEQLDVGAGANDIRTAIEQCADINGTQDFSVNSTVPTKPGGNQGPEAQGVDQLFQWDPNATVTCSGTQCNVTGSCANTVAGCSCPGNPNSLCPNGPHTSPRVAVVAICDQSQTSCAIGGKAGAPITITNFLTFFIDSCNEDASTPLHCKQGGGDLAIDATLISTAGQSFASGGSATPGASFLQTIVLIR